MFVLATIFWNEPPPRSEAKTDFNKQVAQTEAPKVVQPVTPQKVTVAAPKPKKKPITPKAYAKQLAAQRGWTGAEWQALETLWQNESGWNPNAWNTSSGACGIPQSLPCSKIPNWRSVQSQLEWGINYVAGYGKPSEALAFWHCTGNCYSTRVKTTVYKGTTWY